MSHITGILENYLITAKVTTDGRPDPVATSRAEQAITDLLNEAIGEDETTDYQREVAQSPKDLIRNELRTDIRTKLGLTTKEDR